MLTQVAEGVLVHQSELLQNNAVVVQGASGVLLVDPGVQRSEMACLANDLRELGQPVVAGFSTHPDWDHVLWHPELGDAPRYATARGAAFMRDLLSKDDWQGQVAEALPPEIAAYTPLDLFGLLTDLPPETTHIPWDGPKVRIIEHPAHAQGHAALFIEDRGVLIAGDMLSDILMPFPNLDTDNPIEDYLADCRPWKPSRTPSRSSSPATAPPAAPTRSTPGSTLTAPTYRPCATAPLPTTPASAHPPPTAAIGCPACTSSNDKNSARKPAPTSPPIRLSLNR